MKRPTSWLKDLISPGSAPSRNALVQCVGMTVRSKDSGGTESRTLAPDLLRSSFISGDAMWYTSQQATSSPSDRYLWARTCPPCTRATIRTRMVSPRVLPQLLHENIAET